ncbi:hypothetical protein HNQ07_000420 [Deinococcus metalli]|uniref:Uncharacterized protein n=1 Tax=Deinococcus metalli TaxID=1141878 RepID=A0A7W8NMR7_9DEIO|nr:hypothetical protein [Deinococcus metalli]MBB5374976.1 hypothetical protein [Deinococcus metalli]
MTLRATAMIFEGDGRPVLYICAEDHGSMPRPYRVPEDARVTVTAPRPLPDVHGRMLLPAGSCAAFETATARTVLHLRAVRACRELLEAVEAHAQAVQAWRAARAHFENHAGNGEGAA